MPRVTVRRQLKIRAQDLETHPLTQDEKSRSGRTNLCLLARFRRSDGFELTDDYARRLNRDWEYVKQKAPLLLTETFCKS